MTTSQPLSRDALTSIAGLIDDLKAEDASRRLVSMENVVLIAQTIGADRTRTELLPSLITTIYDDDPVLSAFATALPGLYGVVGEPGLVTVMKAFEALLALADREPVRSSCCNALSELLLVLSEENVVTHVVPIIKKLLQSQYFSEHVTGLALLPHILNIVIKTSPTDATELVEQMLGLRTSRYVIVREAVGRCVRRCLEAAPVKDSPLITDASRTYSALEELLADKQDGVAQHAEEATIELVLALYKVTGEEHLSTIVRAALKAFELAIANISVPDATDGVPLLFSNANSWRVRRVFASRLRRLVSVLLRVDDIDCVKDILSSVHELLADIESEVRCAMLDALPKLYATLVSQRRHIKTPAKIDELFLILHSKVKAGLSTTICDETAFVRKHTVLALPQLLLYNCELCAATRDNPDAFGSPEDFHSSLLLFIEQGLSDTEGSIKAALIEKLGESSPTKIFTDFNGNPSKSGTGADIFQELVTSIESLSKSENWRLREAMIDASKFLICSIEETEKPDFSRHIPTLVSVLTTSLEDKTSIVREHAADVIGLLPQKTIHNQLSQITAIKDVGRFSSKIIALRLFANIYQVLGDEFEASVCEVVEGYRKDRCPNVRIATAMLIAKLMSDEGKTSDTLKALFKNVLRDFAMDADVDVRQLSVWRW